MSDKEEDRSKLEPNKSPVSARRAKKLLYLSEYLSKQESRINCKKVSKILKKSAHEHTEDEKATLAKHQDIVSRISKNKEKRKLNQQRVLETEDSEEDLQNKCKKLAKIIQQSKKTVIYTGAGISTAASIPDYRGPQGVWTLLQKGEQLTPQDLSDAEPTLTHMCITQLHKLGHVRHVVSQNCDGLHLRSGLPRHVLSEVHGNMFIELCHNCRPHREYVRLFDVTENTGVRRHFTGRHCQKCGGKLKDTIVHFGEKGGMKSPYRWKEAVRAANKCDLILCLGSSLKILKKYACLWCMDRVKHKRPRLAIVNLQWTPKDESATIKINGRCDDVLDRVMQILQYSIPQYSREEDPIFSLATPLTENEETSTSKKVLEIPEIVPRLRSHGISRTPTPSDSSDSQSSVTSTDSCDTPTDLTNLNAFKQTSVDNFSVFTAESKSDSVTEMKSTAVSSEELCLSRSERICNEAKIAMHERLVNAKINEMYGECSNMQDGTFSNKSARLNGLTVPGKIQLETSVEQQRKLQYDPLRGGPFDPGPATHEDKVKYLQVLQSQLEELKRKQKLLREQEHQHLKQQRQQHMKQVRLSNNELGKQDIKQQIQLQQGPKQTRPVKQETDQNMHLKKETEQESCLEEKQEKFNHLSGISKQPKVQTSKDSKICPKSESSQKINMSPNISVKNKVLIVSDLEKLAVDSSLTDEVEQKLQQNALEQKQLKTTLSAMITNQQRVEEQVKVQHQNEHLRLHQHFLIQEQHRKQLKGGKNEKEEILKLFVYQQQSLLAQQNAVLQCLRQNYMAEVQKVQTAIQSLKQSHSASVKMLEGMKADSRNKELTSVTKSSVANKIPAYSSLEKADTVNVIIKTVENPSVSQELKSPKKDHSIATILQGGSPSKSNSSPSRSNSSAHSKLEVTVTGQAQTCESCQFLYGYGMHKKWCSKCEELKTNSEGVMQILAKSKNRVDITFLEHENVPNLQNTPDTTSDACNSSVEQTEPVYNYVLDLEIPDVKEPKSEDMISDESQVEHNKHNYLMSVNNSVKTNSELKILARNSSERVESENISSISHPKGSTTATPVSTSMTSSVLAEDSNLNEIIVFPCASQGDSGNSMKEKSDTNSSDKKGCASSNKLPDKVTFCLSDEAEGKCRQDKYEDTEKDRSTNENKKVKHSYGIKPVRSHSQSEIYDQKQEVAEEPPGVRHIRCHSHNELDSAEVDILADTEDTESGADTDGVPSAGTEDKDGSEDSVKTGKKRKLARCLSVPGWFGKGLNIKKRRRY